MGYVSMGPLSVSGRCMSVFILGVGGVVVLVASFVAGWWQRVAVGEWSLYADVRQRSPNTIKSRYLRKVVASSLEWKEKTSVECVWPTNGFIQVGRSCGGIRTSFNSPRCFIIWSADMCLLYWSLAGTPLSLTRKSWRSGCATTPEGLL